MPIRKTAAATLAALGLSSLSPVEQGAAVMIAGTAALWANPALAQGTIPGVGIVVKKKPGNAPKTWVKFDLIKNLPLIIPQKCYYRLIRRFCPFEPADLAAS